MKKSLLILLACFLLLSGCGNTEQAAETPLPIAETEAVPQTSSPAAVASPEPTVASEDTYLHRELESMIYFNDTLYSLKQVDKYSGLAEEPRELYGVIDGCVSRYEKPTQNLTTNDELLAEKEIYQFINEIYNDALSVYFDGEEWIYAPYEELPDEMKIYSFQDGQEFVDFAIKHLEDEGYSLSSSDVGGLLQFNDLPEEFTRIDGVFEKELAYSASPRYAQMWYCEEPYMLLILTQESEDEITPTSFGNLTYIDRLRSQLSPEFAWVVTQAHYIDYPDGAYITADLFSAENISDGYGDFIQDVANKA